MTQNQSRRSPKSGGNNKGRKAGFGSIRKLPSGRRQARYTGTDGITYTAPTTFTTLQDARAWLSLRQSEITRNKWKPPQNESMATFAHYAETWLKDRDLKPRTRSHYSALLENRLLPQFGKYRPVQITPDAIRNWHASFGDETPTLRSHCYGLLRTILATAVEDELIPSNPCHIKGAGRAKKVHRTEPATLDELSQIVDAMPTEYKMMTLLGAWCALRFGELVELRRKDIDAENGVIHVRRGAVRVNGRIHIGTPKSEAGIRDVAIPPHLLPSLKKHLLDNVAHGKDSLLFPAVNGGTLHPTTLHAHFYKAREVAGRSDLRFHDLRHSGAVLAASTGATLAELMGRLGHSTPAAALRYQHISKGRDAQIATALSDLAEGKSK
ncbi:MAG: tyrosine-type recombinase/integrase [Candidatus Planktophila sp.]|nr:tyrosine-type recombinase/integrase [Candidatus Planktophila sp.]